MSPTPVLASAPSATVSAINNKKTAIIQTRFQIPELPDPQIEPTPVQVMEGPTIDVIDEFSNSSSFDTVEPTSSLEETPPLTNDDLLGLNSIHDYDEEQEKVCDVFFHFLLSLDIAEQDRIS